LPINYTALETGCVPKSNALNIQHIQYPMNVIHDSGHVDTLSLKIILDL